MVKKEDIVGNWLVRYTKMPLEAFSQHALLTNINHYVDLFCDHMGVPRVGYDANMRAATAGGITVAIVSGLIVSLIFKPRDKT